MVGRWRTGRLSFGASAVAGHLLHGRVLPLPLCDAKKGLHANRALILCIVIVGEGTMREGRSEEHN